MKLTYEELLSPADVPISLSIGHVKQPTLREIWRRGINVFRLYEVYLRLTPNDYFNQLKKDDDNVFWNSLTVEQQENMKLYDVILMDESLAKVYEEVFNFFFVERVIYRDSMYMLINTDDYETPKEQLEINKQNFVGIIHPQNINEVLDILQQVCCLKSDDPLDEPTPKFKNAKAKKLYYKMLEAKKMEKKREDDKAKILLSLPNIISKTAARCPGLNIVNIWDTTLFSLYDQFNATRNFEVYYINAIRVSVWGDEKKQFDESLWYTNNYEKKK